MGYIEPEESALAAMQSADPNDRLIELTELSAPTDLAQEEAMGSMVQQPTEVGAQGAKNNLPSVRTAPGDDATSIKTPSAGARRGDGGAA
jgi:hypothetical protein